MSFPKLLPTAVESETFAGVSYHLDGELVPALTIMLTEKNTIYFEHHVLLWKSPTVRIGMRPIKGAFKRVIAGMQIFMTEAAGPGPISFSRDGAGHIAPIHLQAGQELQVREHQLLAATANVEYTFERIRGVSNILFGGTGFFIDKFRSHGEGIIWVHGYGNVFEKTLEAGEQIDIEPGAWLYKDPSVRMETVIQNLSTGLFSGINFMMNRFTGPGRVGLQSMSLYIPEAK